MKATPRISQQIVLVGGGHSHIEVLRLWAMARSKHPRIQILLISPTTETFYSGMLPGFIAKDYARKDITIDLLPLTARADIQFLQASVESIDCDRQVVTTNNGIEVPYDILSLDIGSRSLEAPFSLDNPRVMATRPFDRLLRNLDSWQESLDESQESCLCIGAGAAGFELTLAMQKRFSKISKFSILDRNDPLSQRLQRKLRSRGIDYLSNQKDYDLSMDSIGIHLDSRLDGKTVKTETFTRLIWAAGAAAHKLSWIGLGDRGLQNGFLVVDKNLSSIERAEIFAVGDCAHLQDAPWVVKAGVYPVRQGPVLFRNLILAAENNADKLGHIDGEISTVRNLESYQPQKRFLRLLNFSDGTADFQYGCLHFSGRWAWRWKDKIDRTFMRKYSEVSLAPGIDPNCGGCGSKVSAASLNRVLSTHKPKDEIRNEDIAVVQFKGAGAGADVDAGAGAGAGISADKRRFSVGISVDAFRSPNLPFFEIGKIAVHHASSDFYASGIRPEALQVAVTVKRASDRLQEFELSELIRGIQLVCDEEEIVFSGGQSSEGSESQIAVFLVGPTNSTVVHWKNTPIPADSSLLLTKALGSGLLMTASMMGAISGTDHSLVVQNMLQSNRRAFEIMNKFSVLAATDITGFGLAGHLIEMCGTSKPKIEMNWAKLPIMPGAQRALDSGYRARIHESNRQYAIDSQMFYEAPEIAFDPQTSGGILFVVPRSEEEDALLKLREEYPATEIIGHS